MKFRTRTGVIQYCIDGCGSQITSGSVMELVPVVNSMQLARDAESDHPLRDVGSLQNNFLDCRRSSPAARRVAGRDSRVAEKLWNVRWRDGRRLITRAARMALLPAAVAY
jgi:hypothetical protein